MQIAIFSLHYAEKNANQMSVDLKGMQATDKTHFNRIRNHEFLRNRNISECVHTIHITNYHPQQQNEIKMQAVSKMCDKRQGNPSGLALNV